MKIELNVKIEPTAKCVSQMLKIEQFSGIAGMKGNEENMKIIKEHLDEFYRDIIQPIKTFDGVVFQEDKKVIRIHGGAYIQAIKESNQNAWMWESINLDHYFVISDMLKKGVIPTVKELLRKENVPVAYYLYCKKHDLEPFGQYYDPQREALPEALFERIRCDFEAEAMSLYEGYREADYMPEQWNPSKHKEEYLYELIEEARENYEGTTDQEEDREEALETVRDKWMEYLPDDKYITEALDELKERIK